jgi:hypothetical protein
VDPASPVVEDVAELFSPLAIYRKGVAAGQRHIPDQKVRLGTRRAH